MALNGTYMAPNRADLLFYFLEVGDNAYIVDEKNDP